MRTQLLLPLALSMLQVGCTAMRDAHPVTPPESNIPALDVNVEVQEAPGLFQGTKSSRNALYRP